jgi:hypothetical protein
MDGSTALHVEAREGQPRRFRDLARRRLMEAAPRDDVAGRPHDLAVPRANQHAELPAEHVIAMARRVGGPATRRHPGNASFF